MAARGGRGAARNAAAAAWPACVAGLVDVTAVNALGRDSVHCRKVCVPTFEAALEEANNTRFGLAAGDLGQRGAVRAV
jgi:hypothetical protein